MSSRKTTRISVTLGDDAIEAARAEGMADGGQSVMRRKESSNSLHNKGLRMARKISMHHINITITTSEELALNAACAASGLTASGLFAGWAHDHAAARLIETEARHGKDRKK